MIKKLCKECGKPYITVQVSRSQFCSKSCANSYNTRQRFTKDKSIFVNGSNDEFTLYTMGFIGADGCISYDAHSKRNQITITSNDFEIIQIFHEHMTPNKKIYKQNKNYKVISRNQKDVDYLKSMGISERKTKTIKIPKNINPNLMNHFIRGWFDGDGSVYIEKRTFKVKDKIVTKYYDNISFTTGSFDFAQDLQKVLKKYNIDSKINKDSRKTETIYVKIRKKQEVKKFYNWLYKDASIYLTRKKIKFANQDIV